MNSAALPMLWANCVERLKDKVNNRSFWEALEQSRPITVEADTLIIGMETGNFTMASHIQQPGRFHLVQQTVQEVFGQPYQVRLIEGATQEDWEGLKQREQIVANMRQQEVQGTATTAPRVLEGWDSLLESFNRLFAQTAFRSMPQGKARFMNQALYTLVEAMDTLYTEGEDASERSLARALDRIASNVEVPAPMLAFELERLRAWRQAENGG